MIISIIGWECFVSMTNEVEVADKQSQRLKNSKWYYLLISLLFIAIIFSTIFSISVGQVTIPFNESFQIVLHKLSGGYLGSLDNLTNQSFVNIIWQLRFPRVLFALLIGMGLAVCGTILQAVVQNPLADPYILGISSGASLGATFAILIGFSADAFFSQFGIAFGAFAGALAATLAVLVIASVGGKITSIKLILAGTVISSLCGAFSSLIIYFANNAEGIKTVTFWSMGSLASASWSKLPILTVIVVSGSLLFLFQHRVLNTMLLGDEVAITLGIDLGRFRRFYMLLTALITGTIVAYAGMIGFVGLIIPHITRSLIGSDHKRLVPAVLLIGSLFLIWSDILSRTLIANVELPIGIITSVIGAPLFIYMLIKKSYNFGG